MNVYVPEDLRERMKKSKVEVNWSSVACEAFTAHLDGVSAGSGDWKTPERIAERLLMELRRTQMAADARREKGRRWAAEVATAFQMLHLRNVVEFARYSNKPVPWARDALHHYGLPPGVVFGGVLLQEPNAEGAPFVSTAPSNKALEAFEKNVGDFSVLGQDVEFLNDFADGVVETWDSVRGFLPKSVLEHEWSDIPF